jgi:hypothetical protein
MGQRAYCTAIHPVTSDQEADRWCEMYHHVELPKRATNRAPKEAIRRLRIIQARLEALSDSTTPDAGPASNPLGHGRTSEATAAIVGRPYVTSVTLEHRQAVAPYIDTWILNELAQILPWLEGGERPLWYDTSP